MTTATKKKKIIAKAQPTGIQEPGVEVVKKKNAGRPPKYITIEEMQAKIDTYFARCEAQEKPKTMTGLALALDLTCQGLSEYQAKPIFSETVKKAKELIISDVELRLFSPQCTGAIFWLKNHAGYSDKQAFEHSGPSGGPINIEVAFVSTQKKA